MVTSRMLCEGGARRGSARRMRSRFSPYPPPPLFPLFFCFLRSTCPYFALCIASSFFHSFRSPHRVMVACDIYSLLYFPFFFVASIPSRFFFPSCSSLFSSFLLFHFPHLVSPFFVVSFAGVFSFCIVRSLATRMMDCLGFVPTVEY